MTPCFVVGWFSEGKDRPATIRNRTWLTLAEAEAEAAHWNSSTLSGGEFRALVLTDPGD